SVPTGTPHTFRSPRPSVGQAARLPTAAKASEPLALRSDHSRHAHAQGAGRQAQVGRHLGALLGHLLLDLLQGLVGRRPDQVLQELPVAGLEDLLAELAAHHLAAAVDAHLDHAGARVAVGHDLAEGLLELLHFFLNLGRIVEQAEDLAELPEHRHASSPSPAPSGPGPGGRPAAGAGVVLNPSSTRTTWAPSTSMARLITGSLSASSRCRRARARLFSVSRGACAAAAGLPAAAPPDSTRSVQGRPVTRCRASSTFFSRAGSWQCSLSLS